MKLSTLTITRLEKVASDLKMRLNEYTEMYDVGIIKEGKSVKLLVDKVEGVTHLMTGDDVQIIYQFCQRRKLTFMIFRITGRNIQVEIY